MRGSEAKEAEISDPARPDIKPLSSPPPFLPQLPPPSIQQLSDFLRGNLGQKKNEADQIANDVAWISGLRGRPSPHNRNTLACFR